MVNIYALRAHMVTQDLLNEENGGIKDEDLCINFESGNPEFTRSFCYLILLFENAESIFKRVNGFT